MASAIITPERLREVLSYDPLTGEFFWRVKLGTAQKGDRAGCLNAGGYLVIKISKRLYYCHRLAWVYVNGKWPEPKIDHFNGNRADNRIANLREASNRMNGENRRAAIPNKLHGTLLGVRRSTSTINPWWSTITAHGVVHHLGSYPTEEQAHAAYLEAKRRLHTGNTL